MAGEVGERLAHVLEQALHDLEHVFQRLVGLALTPFHVDLEKRDGPREVGRDSVVQVARDARSLARHRVLDRLVGEPLIGHRAAILRLANDSSSAITSGWRSQRKIRLYGCHKRSVSSRAARSCFRSAAIWPRSLSSCADSARARRAIRAPHTIASTPSTTIASVPATSSQTPIQPSVLNGLLL